MNTYLVLFTLAAGMSLVLTPVIRRISEHYCWLDEPRDDRRVHRAAVSRLGGVAIYISVFSALAALTFVDNHLTQTLKASRPHLFYAFLPATLMFLFGLYDDLRGSGARLKFVAQGLAGALFYAVGGRIEVLSLPFVGTVELPGMLSLLLTIIWIVGITNAFNLIDGLDGLAAGAALFASLVMLVVALMLGHSLVAVGALTLSGALIGFLRYNFNPASIFLGDSGSLFIGCALATLSLQGSQKASTAVAVVIPLLAFGVPIIDTGVAIMRRYIGGRPLFEGDREHIHHMLLARGWSQRRVVSVLYGVCALFGLLALLFVNESGRSIGLILFVVGVAVIVAIGRLRYHEVDEVKAGMRRNLSERRMRAANNIRVRRAVRAMSKAATLSDLFRALREMLEISEFVYAVAQVGRGGDGERNERALAREMGARGLHGVEVRGGLIYWSWERGDIETKDIIGSGRFWTLRLPLSTERAGWGYINLYRELGGDPLLLDVNYLCDVFQRELALAAERIILAADDNNRVEDAREPLHAVGAAR